MKDENVFMNDWHQVREAKTGFDEYFEFTITNGHISHETIRLLLRYMTEIREAIT